MCSKVRIINVASNSTNESSESDKEPKNVGKFVIIAFEDQLHLVHGPIDEFSYHAELVKAYCDRYSIPSGWLKKPDVYEIFGNSHVVKGGGWLEENAEDRHLRIFGYSTAYGRFNEEDIVHLSLRAEELADYRISIED